MGKIVKFCSACEESFAEKFSYCPNCAAELTAFEMTPVAEKTSEPAPEPEPPAILRAEEPLLEIPAAEPVKPEPEIREAAQEPEVQETAIEPEPLFDEVVSVEAAGEDSLTFEPEEVEIEPEQEEVWVEEEPAGFAQEETVSFSADEDAEHHGSEKATAAGSFLGLLEVEDKSSDQSAFEYDADEIAKYDFDAEANDENFRVTVISDRSSGTRNGLMLGAFALIFFGFVGLLVYSLFSNLGDVASLVDDERIVSMLDDIPVELEEEQKKADDEEGGGGGGGGKEEEKPVSKGELVTQTRPPMTPPSPTIPRLPDPSLPVIMSTEGDIKRNRIEPPGMPNALSTDPSSGPGSGGGMGRGTGTGMGDGFGTGEGTGTGSGSGGGVGDGNGNGRGSGSGGPPVRSGPTTDIRILSKPRPGYTDEARQNNVRGTVILRVTFLASGSIGSVSTVKGLPYGLTEKAIAAARQIRFTPPMRNGQPYTVNKVVHFNFTIY